MDLNFLIFCLLGGIVYADTDAVGQFMISQPLVACSMAGAVFGNLQVGLAIGLLLQLPYLVEIPCGGARLSLGNMGAYVGAGVAAELTGVFQGSPYVLLLVAVSFGIVLSWGTVPLQGLLRRFNFKLTKYADSAIADGRLDRISLFNYLSALTAFCFGVVYCFVFFVIGEFSASAIIQNVPAGLESVVRLVRPVLLGAGVGALFWQFVKKSTIQSTVLGVGLSTLVLLVVWAV